ncbi:MAG TPA: D-alanyl-D-alanine carboxypeptidase, partial [Ferruginibacter sp.]|nr:D-alanyl-D-alanine carboxypeptidase [Ferruginibacter sp.]
KLIGKQASNILLKDTAISTGHIGISIYEPASNTYWFNYNATKNFIPASNTKLFTLYAGLKYLGDSLVAARLQKNRSAITIYPSGDPTFLNSAFKFQPLFSILKSYPSIYINNNTWKDDALGNGWAWNDYNESYMAERSSFPIYENLIEFSFTNESLAVSNNVIQILSGDGFDYDSETKKISSGKFFIERSFENNDFYIKSSRWPFKKNSIPFKTHPEFIADILKDTLHCEDVTFFRSSTNGYTDSLAKPNLQQIQNQQVLTTAIKAEPNNVQFTIHSQPTDSLFKPMMHRSDNFFAEQTLLMASNEHLGFMNDEKIIDTILNTDLKDIPQKPRWVDGSGLSRYNLFTPQSFVFILNKMKNEFGWNRIKNILATGGTGTLLNYYKKDSSFIYAKTGTLSNNCALSGYLITKKGKFLIFSVLVNNYQSGSTPVRRAVEKFIEGIREKY